MQIIDVDISEFPKTVRQLAEEEGVTPGAIYRRRYKENHLREYFRRYRENHYDQVRKREREYYARNSDVLNRKAAEATNRYQEETTPSATNHYQLWVLHDIKELERRVKNGETSVKIAKEVGRTYKAVDAAIDRFRITRRNKIAS